MLSKRVIPCLDVRNGKLTKGIKFAGNVDIGDPVESARKYYEEGADEIVFYDITASAEDRGIFLDVVERVAANIFIPFSVGGGIRSVADMRAVLLAGAEKISINSAAVQNPRLISEGADAFGSQAVVVGMDVLRVPQSEAIPSGYEIVINGGRKRMGIDAIAWAKECERLGAGEHLRKRRRAVRGKCRMGVDIGQHTSSIARTGGKRKRGTAKTVPRRPITFRRGRADAPRKDDQSSLRAVIK